MRPRRLLGVVCGHVLIGSADLGVCQRDAGDVELLLSSSSE